MSEHLDHRLEEVAARRGVGHIRAAAAVFRVFALNIGCSEMDILDYNAIRKGKKRPDSQAVLKEELGLLQEALARWLNPTASDFLNMARGKNPPARIGRISKLLARHYSATKQLEEDLSPDLPKEARDGDEALMTVLKKQKKLITSYFVKV